VEDQALIILIDFEMDKMRGTRNAGREGIIRTTMSHKVGSLAGADQVSEEGNSALEVSCNTLKAQHPASRVGCLTAVNVPKEKQCK
jgi:hypothetical protein